MNVPKVDRSLEVAQLYKIMAWANPGQDLERRSAYCFGRGLIVDAFARWADGRQIDRLVDVGCGVGLVTREIIRHARHTLAVDVSQIMLDALTAACGLQNRQTEASPRPLDTLVDRLPTLERLPASSADVMLSTDTLYYLPPADLATFGQRAFEVLRPGGFLVFNDNGNAAAIAAGLSRFFEVSERIQSPVSIKAKPRFDAGYQRTEPRYLYARGLFNALSDPGFDPQKELSEVMHRRLFKECMRRPWLVHWLWLLWPARAFSRFFWSNDFLFRQFCIAERPADCLWVLKRRCD